MLATFAPIEEVSTRSLEMRMERLGVFKRAGLNQTTEAARRKAPPTSRDTKVFGPKQTLPKVGRVKRHSPHRLTQIAKLRHCELRRKE